MVINTNVSAQSAARLLADSSARLTKSLARLSSGSKIVSPEDDAAGMAVSQRFDAQINRISAASSNVGNSISFCQTQDGFLSKVGKALDRMSELAVLAQDTTKTNSDRDLYQKEFKTLQSYISDIAGKSFNSVNLFGSNAITVTIDSDPTATNGFTMAGIDMGSGNYSAVMAATVSIGTLTDAVTTLGTVKTAISTVASDRAQIGANIVRLTSTQDQLGVLKDNITAANSRIKDVDVADESTQFARYNILVQAGTAMLAQANATTQAALRLLQ